MVYGIINCNSRRLFNLVHSITLSFKKGLGEFMNKKWFKAAGIRAIKTVAQTAVATIGTSAVINEVDWIAVVSASLLAGILSLLTSVAGLPEVERDTHD